MFEQEPRLVRNSLNALVKNCLKPSEQAELFNAWKEQLPQGTVKAIINYSLYFLR